MLSGARRLLARVPERWRFPLTAFGLSRLLVWLGLVLAWNLAAGVRGSDPKTTTAAVPVGLHGLGYGLDLLGRWDSVWFVGIARHGYSFNPDATAFFPLYPALMAVVGRVFGGEYLIAGVLLALASGFAAFVLLDRLGRALLGEAAARRSLLYLAVYPATLFLGMAYSESLYLLLAVAAFLLAERGRFLGSGAVAGLAVLTRLAGLALLPALVLFALRAPNRRRALLELAVAPVMAAAYPLYLWARTGHPLLFLGAESHGWGRRASWWGPLAGIGQGLHAGFAGLEQLFAGSGSHTLYWHWVSDTPVPRAAATSVLLALYLIVLLALTAAAWRYLGPPYGLFCALSLALALSSPPYFWPLLSLPRFGLGLFPVFLALGVVASRRRLHVAILAVSGLMLGIAIMEWSLLLFVS